MAALMFSWLCRTLMVAAVATFTFADQQITRHTGTNVTLEVQVPNGTTSIWLQRPGSDKYIFYCQDRTPTRPKDQEESFKGRVKTGLDCDNIDGTVSVTVSNLTQNDSGTYEFHGVDRDDRRFNKSTFLNVTDSGPTGGTTEDGGKQGDGETDEEMRGHYCILALVLASLVIVVVASKVCPTSMKDLKHLLNSALSEAKTNDQEVMERAASFPLLGRPQTA